GRGAPRGPGAKGPSAFRLPLAMFSERALGLEAPQIPFATQRLQPFDALDEMRLRCFQATAHAQRIAERALRFVDEPILRRHHFASERVRTFELFDRFVAAPKREERAAQGQVRVRLDPLLLGCDRAQRAPQMLFCLRVTTSGME